MAKSEERNPMYEKMSSNVIAIPTTTPHYTLDDWYTLNRERYKYAEAQHHNAGRIIAESERIIDESSDRVHVNKKEVDHQLEVKVKDIDFLKSTVEAQKKEMDLEIEALLVYKERILDAQKALGTKSLDLCKKCLILREGRLGIDLCIDDVELELKKEIQLLDGVKVMYVKILGEVNEQIRRLRAMNYLLIRDIEDKSNVLFIDKKNAELKESNLSLSIYHGATPLDSANITREEWIAHSQANIDAAHKELVTGRPLRAYIDTLLKQIIEDLWKQYDVVNDAFNRRIEEYKEVKVKLENQHFETVRQINEITLTLTKLQKSIAEKECFMALAHTRLGNRCQRAGNELCRDEVETYLVHEVCEIKEVVTQLQQMLSEATAALRYLLRTQVQLEEDINVKINSIKIDEVECMTLRKGMDYHAY